MSTITRLEERIHAVREQVAEAARDGGRDPGEVTLIAVSKTFPREDIEAAYDLGVRHFGENRVQEAQEKVSAPLPDDATLHLIGHLQSNKAKFVPGLFDTVDSVDRSSIIDALDKAVAKADGTLNVLLQVNIAGEEQKAGCAPDEAPALIEQIAATGTLAPRGLMTIAPIDATGDDLHAIFLGLGTLRDDLQAQFPHLDLRELSMGMSNDYREAIAEGATQVRIGRAIFGER
ncbi:MAG TPA: YggS family pyridoxal phosphate-dependent enzyme [Thermomicrobiales bacterium]|nr:YggS family pyridoxal phosphate-dependent enzyme [Thermomicrobiales bacterium]